MPAMAIHVAASFSPALRGLSSRSKLVTTALKAAGDWLMAWTYCNPITRPFLSCLPIFNPLCAHSFQCCRRVSSFLHVTAFPGLIAVQFRPDLLPSALAVSSVPPLAFTFDGFIYHAQFRINRSFSPLLLPYSPRVHRFAFFILLQ